MAKVYFYQTEKVLDSKHCSAEVPQEVIEKGEKAIKDHIQKNADFDYLDSKGEDVLESFVDFDIDEIEEMSEIEGENE